MFVTILYYVYVYGNADLVLILLKSGWRRVASGPIAK